MEILFISCAYSEDRKEAYRKDSRRGYQFAAQNYQESLIQGFLENGAALSVCSVPSLSTWPIGCRMLRIGCRPFIFRGKECGISAGFLNLPLFNRMESSEVRQYVKDWCVHAEGPRAVVVYGLHPHLMKTALAAKTSDPGLKLVSVVPDLPQYMAYNRYLKALGFQKRDIRNILSMVKRFDAFIPLTAPMMDALEVAGKPFRVVEGIFSGSFPEEVKAAGKVIMYAGGTNARYGILDLLKAFRIMDGEDLRLWICGTGDAVECIKQAALDDPRIEYFGILPREKVLEMERQATVLVNPRHSGEEFTRYSFPSKTLEYLASGTAVAMNRLRGIPEEYDRHLHYFADESPEGMAATLKGICSLEEGELERMGRDAASFVRERKSAATQCAAILQLIERI